MPVTMFGPARGDGGLQSSQSPFGPSGNRRNLPRSAREQRKANRVSAWGDGSLGKAANFEALTFEELQVKLIESGLGRISSELMGLKDLFINLCR